MKIAFDTEFIEDGKTIELLSIGMVREDGATYYAETELAEALKAAIDNDWEHKVDPWLVENVFPGIKGDDGKSLDTIANDIWEFVGEQPEFWAWYGSYDWVALCQLYGRMIDLPDGWPMYVRDYKQVCDSNGRWSFKQTPEDTPGDEHNALNDALWLAKAMRWTNVISMMFERGLM